MTFRPIINDLRLCVAMVELPPQFWFRFRSLPCYRLFGHQVKLAQLVLQIRRGSITECRVPWPRVIEALDVIEHIRLGIIPRSVDIAGCPLSLE